jgi:hypothetical protein
VVYFLAKLNSNIDEEKAVFEFESCAVRKRGKYFSPILLTLIFGSMSVGSRVSGSWVRTLELLLYSPLENSSLSILIRLYLHPETLLKKIKKTAVRSEINTVSLMSRLAS